MRVALFLAAVVPTFASGLSVGLKMGVPVTDIVRTNGYEIGGLPFQANVNRFAIGPVEFGAIYKQFHQQAGQVQIIREVGSPFQILTSPYSQTGRSWEFPITGQYRFPGSVLRPYLEAGVCFNHLSSLFSPFRTTSANLTGIIKPDHFTENRRGVTIGAGLDFKLPVIHVTPGIRYTRYGQAEIWLPSATAVDFLVGFTF